MPTEHTRHNSPPTRRRGISCRIGGPDGGRIAYSSLATGAGDIYVMNADGTGQTRLTSDPGREIGPAWSPDGTRIAFLRFRDPTASAVYIMDADGSDQHPMHPGVRAGLAAAWQRRGRLKRVCVMATTRCTVRKPSLCSTAWMRSFTSQ
jgi:dipeptidyl aminopeptidase/acylaminoacyl peptidase